MRKQIGKHYTPSANTSTSAPSALATSSGSANTKGSWTELVTSTAYAGSLVVNMRSGPFDALVDVGIGGAGSETVIASNLAAGNQTTLRDSFPYWIPIPIPAGTRIAARCQDTTGGNTVNVGVNLLRGRSSCGAIETAGAATGDSGGTSIDPGGTINTKGSWTQITASTSRSWKAFQIGFGNNNDSSRTTCNWLVDIGVGGAGSEVVIVQDYPIACRAEIDVVMPKTSHVIDIPIPAGTRIAVRAQSDINTAGDRLFDIIIYGHA